MQTEIKKWGSSAVVRLPVSILAQLKLAVGAQLELKTEGGRIIIEPAAKPVYKLEDLVGGITDGNRHDASDWGRPVGSEVIL